MNGVETWLRARLDEDERAAREALVDGPPSPWSLEGDQPYPNVTGADGDTVIDTQSGFAPPTRSVLVHIALWHPARVLAEIEAKRRILAEIVEEANALDSMVDHDRRIGSRDHDTEPYLGDALVRLLAEMYADEPGYDPTWKLDRDVYGRAADDPLDR